MHRSRAAEADRHPPSSNVCIANEVLTSGLSQSFVQWPTNRPPVSPGHMSRGGRADSDAAWR